jgi:hypothetical protein
MAPPPEDEVVIIDGDDSPLQPPTASAAGLSPTSIFGFRGTSSASALDADAIEPRLPSPTPVVVEVGTGAVGTDALLQMPPSEARPTDVARVQVCEGDALAFVSAPTVASSFAFGTGVRSFSSAAFTDAVTSPTLPFPMPAAPPPPPRPTPATPSSPRTGACRHLVAFGLSLPSPPSSGRGRRVGTRSPEALGLANGVASGAGLLEYSSYEDDRGGSGSGRR